MQVHGLFYVAETARQSGSVAQGGTANGNLRVTLLPVVRPTDDNVEWSKYTPSGKIEITVTADGAQEFFEQNLGKDVPITFG